MVSKQEIKKLRERWTEKQSFQVLTWLKKNNINRLAKMQIEVDGQSYSDCRGIEPVKTILHLQASNVDFSYSRFPPFAGFGYARLTNCLFIGCHYVGNLSDSFEQCDFSHATMVRCSSIPVATFTQCSFVKANLSSADFFGASFDRCDFSSAKLTSAQFFECVFRKCTFHGASVGFCAFSSCRFKEPTESFEWKDVDTDEIVRRETPNATRLVDFKKAFVAGLTFE